MKKKLRNRLIALACVIAFVAGGALFYTNWVVQKPFAVILIIGDGMTPGMLAATRLYANGANHRLNVEKFPNLAVLRTAGIDYAVPDSASAATALSSGKLVNHRNLGVDTKRPNPTLFDLARSGGRLTGLISNAALTDATPAAFYAKTQDALDHFAIAEQLVDESSIDVIFGGGEGDFLPDSKGGRRTDGQDLVLELRRNGYEVIRNQSELESTPPWRAPRVVGLFAQGNLDYSDEARRNSSQPTLSDMVRQAIQLLQFNPKGYFLVVDAGLITKACQSNLGERALQEILEFDRAVEAAITYAGPDALIIATGKQSVGGLRLNGFPFTHDRGVSIIGMNSQGIPSLTWSTGPGGVDADNPDQNPEPASFQTPTAVGVAEDVLAVGTGPGTEALSGFLDNTSIYDVLKKQM